MLVASSMFSPSGIRKKPIACSYTLSLKSFFFLISSLDEIFPFAFLYESILSMLFFLIPDTYFNKDGDAVLMFTPTLLTAFDTTKSKLSDSFLPATSC